MFNDEDAKIAATGFRLACTAVGFRPVFNDEDAKSLLRVSVSVHRSGFDRCLTTKMLNRCYRVSVSVHRSGFDRCLTTDTRASKSLLPGFGQRAPLSGFDRCLPTQIENRCERVSVFVRRGRVSTGVYIRMLVLVALQPGFGQRASVSRCEKCFKITFTCVSGCYPTLFIPKHLTSI